MSSPPPAPPPDGYGSPDGYGAPGWAPPPAGPPGYPTAGGYPPPGGFGYPPPGAYGHPPPGGYGFGYAYGYGGGRADHPQGTAVLVLGICSLVTGFGCGLGFLLGPVAWVMGNGALREIDAQPDRYANRSQVQAGRICGMVATGIVVLAVLAFTALVVAGSSGRS